MDHDRRDGPEAGSDAGPPDGAGPAAADPAGGETLKDASDEAVAEMKKRRDGGGHAGAGDIG